MENAKARRRGHHVLTCECNSSSDDGTDAISDGPPISPWPSPLHSPASSSSSSTRMTTRRRRPYFLVFAVCLGAYGSFRQLHSITVTNFGRVHDHDGNEDLMHAVTNAFAHKSTSTSTSMSTAATNNISGAAGGENGPSQDVGTIASRQSKQLQHGHSAAGIKEYLIRQNVSSADDWVAASIPAHGPDERIVQKLKTSLPSHMYTTAGKGSSSSFMIEHNFTEPCSPTSQLRLWFPPLPDAHAAPFWLLQTLDVHGRPKQLGGDEFYITFRKSAQTNMTPMIKSNLVEDPANHPTAVAKTEHVGNGVYRLDFWTTPMYPDSNSLSLSRPQSSSSLSSAFASSSRTNVTDTTITDASGGNITISLTFTCGVGTLPPPIKQKWNESGAIQFTYTAQTPRDPPIRQFVPPQRTIDFSAFDHVLLVGDSVMGQWGNHEGLYFRSHLSTTRNVATALNTRKVPNFINSLRKYLPSILNRLQEQRSSPKPIEVLLVLGSSTWDLLANDASQANTFEDHAIACRQLIVAVNDFLAHNITELVTATATEATATAEQFRFQLAWKSVTAVHPHIVIDRHTKWFGPPHKAKKRIRYMSLERSELLHAVQQRALRDVEIPFLDIFDATYLSADWHLPVDGRHYRPELNELMLNWFYSESEKEIDLTTIDHRYSGYK